MKLSLIGYFPGYPHTAPRRLELELTAPTLLGRVLASLGIPIAEVHLAAVNGELVDLQTAVVQQVDEVKIFPAMDGG
jgi:sulfur carrier protein ThiS